MTLVSKLIDLLPFPSPAHCHPSHSVSRTAVLSSAFLTFTCQSSLTLLLFCLLHFSLRFHVLVSGSSHQWTSHLHWNKSKWHLLLADKWLLCYKWLWRPLFITLCVPVERVKSWWDTPCSLLLPLMIIMLSSLSWWWWWCIMTTGKYKAHWPVNKCNICSFPLLVHLHPCLIQPAHSPSSSSSASSPPSLCSFISSSLTLPFPPLSHHESINSLLLVLLVDLSLGKCELPCYWKKGKLFRPFFCYSSFSFFFSFLCLLTKQQVVNSFPPRSALFLSFLFSPWTCHENQLSLCVRENKFPFSSLTMYQMILHFAYITGEESRHLSLSRSIVDVFYSLLHGECRHARVTACHIFSPLHMPN